MTAEERIIDFRKSYEKIHERAKKAEKLLKSTEKTLNEFKKNPEKEEIKTHLLKEYSEILELMGEFSKACTYCRSYGFRVRMRSHTHKMCCGKYDELLVMRNEIEKELRESDMVG